MPTPINADEMMRTHPHPAFEKVLSRGYTVEYWFDVDDEIGRELYVQIRTGEAVIAGANFMEDTGLRIPLAYNQNVSVDKAYRRQGLANAMYVLAEMILGTPLVDFWKDVEGHQTDEAKALW